MKTVRQAGRALGRVRDVDVTIALLGELERTAPAAAGVSAELRRSLAGKQLSSRRRLVKEFDGLALASLKDAAAQLPRSRRVFPGGERCGTAIKDSLREQAVTLRQSIEHGSGVYFPKRAHDVRIDAKKLRYVLELTEDAESIAPGGIKLLRKAQATLGDLHDREVLRRRFAALDTDGGRGTSTGAAAALAAIDAECQNLFAEYLLRRPALLDVCSAIERYTSHSSWSFVQPATLVRVAAVALPAALLAIQRPARRRAKPRPESAPAAHSGSRREREERDPVPVGHL